MESSAAAGDTKVVSETCDDQKQHEQSVPGRSYVPWSGVEVEALRLGVQRHGVGAWQIILRDPDFEVLTCVTHLPPLCATLLLSPVLFAWNTQLHIAHLPRPVFTAYPWKREYGFCGRGLNRVFIASILLSQMSQWHSAQGQMA
jgi:hypothetical protein